MARIPSGKKLDLQKRGIVAGGPALGGRSCQCVRQLVSSFSCTMRCLYALIPAKPCARDWYECSDFGPHTGITRGRIEQLGSAARGSCSTPAVLHGPVAFGCLLIEVNRPLLLRAVMRAIGPGADLACFRPHPRLRLAIAVARPNTWATEHFDARTSEDFSHSIGSVGERGNRSRTTNAGRRVADLVKTGKLRFGLFPPQYVKDPATGDLKSAWVEVARALAGRIGIELVLLEHPTPPKAIECLKAGACDAIFLPRDDRAAGVADFSAPYMQFDYTFLVPSGSSIHRVGEADRSGVRIAAVRNHASTNALILS